jgi:hypothetical protein
VATEPPGGLREAGVRARGMLRPTTPGGATPRSEPEHRGRTLPGPAGRTWKSARPARQHQADGGARSHNQTASRIASDARRGLSPRLETARPCSPIPSQGRATTPSNRAAAGPVRNRAEVDAGVAPLTAASGRTEHTDVASAAPFRRRDEPGPISRADLLQRHGRLLRVCHNTTTRSPRWNRCG